MTDVEVDPLLTEAPVAVDPSALFEEAAAARNITRLEGDFGMLKENMDVFFLLVISFNCFFLQAGFAFLEVGAVRSKNATNILIKNMLDVFLGGIAFWLIGYAIAHGEGNGFIGTTHWAIHDLEDMETAQWFFHFVFAATAATIVSGSVAERCAFNAYFIYSIALTGFVYPVVAHWAWSGDGWLGATSYHDFAGSGVVHLTGGVAALVGAVVLGPRIGRFEDPQRGPALPMTGHSVPLTGLGGFILLFGFLSFNGGSQGSISNPGDAAAVARAVVNTVISGSSGGISVLLVYRLGDSHSWSFLMALNGSLAGMVSVCSGCDVYRPWGACVTGVVGGLVFLGFHYLVIKIKVDDPLDAVAVHVGGGMWGLLATGLFKEDGIVYGSSDGLSVLLWNFVGLLSIVAWSGGVCLIMFGAMRALNILRVPEEIEIKGMDILKHGEPAYPAEAWIEEQYYSKFYEKGGRPASRRNSSLPFQMMGPISYKGTTPSTSNGANADVPRCTGTSQTCFYPEKARQSPAYWSMHDHRWHGPPNCNAMELQQADPSLMQRKNNKKAYTNQAFSL